VSTVTGTVDTRQNACIFVVRRKLARKKSESPSIMEDSTSTIGCSFSPGNKYI
jgi:hypothetical protein